MRLLKEAVSGRFFKVCSVVSVLAFCLVMSAFASNNETATMDTIVTDTVTSLTTVQQALLNMISQILPIALVVMGSALVVTLGIRLFRRFAG